MFKLVLGIVVLIVGVVVALFIPKMLEQDKRKVVRLSILGVTILVSLIFILMSTIVTLSPGQVGLAYHLNGSNSQMKVGYNFVAPWAKMHRWDTTMQVITFSEGEAVDDIYGAQTTEKDYIKVIATIGVHIDTSRMNDYIALYGNEQITSSRITRLLKTVSRNSIEKTIGSYTTADAMSNKKKIGEESEEQMRIAIAELPIVMDSFTIDDLVAPESYENAIKEQAKLRMDRDKAALQQQINEQEALANKTKAEGEAAVKKTQAEADAAVKEIEAQNAASVAKIQADNQAEVKKIQAEAEANVRRIQAEAKATETTTQANAEAEATVKKGEAEASAIVAQGEAYKKNPELIDLRKVEINAEVQKQWADRWSGYSFEGMSGLNFTNFTDILKGLIPSVNTPTSVAN